MKELEMFSGFMLNHGKSKLTVKDTLATAKEFLLIMEINSLEDIKKLTSLDIETYLSNIRNQGNSDSTRKTKVARVRMFFNFLYNNELIDKNVMHGQTIKCGTPEIAEFSHSDVIKVLNNAKSLRDYVTLYTLMGTGMRVSELVEARCDKIVSDTCIQVFGKGNKWRGIQCPEKVISVIRDYIEKTADIRKNSPYIFITKSGEKLNRNNISTSLKNMAKRANIDNYERFSAHKVRHMYAMHALNKLKIPLDVVSKNLGHSSVGVTSQIYAKTDVERVQEYVSKINEDKFFGKSNFETRELNK